MAELKIYKLDKGSIIYDTSMGKVLYATGSGINPNLRLDSSAGEKINIGDHVTLVTVTLREKVLVPGVLRGLIKDVKDITLEQYQRIKKLYDTQHNAYEARIKHFRGKTQEQIEQLKKQEAQTIRALEANKPSLESLL